MHGSHRPASGNNKVTRAEPVKEPRRQESYTTFRSRIVFTWTKSGC
jgi:hypothetical protein